MPFLSNVGFVADGFALDLYFSQFDSQNPDKMRMHFGDCSNRDPSRMSLLPSLAAKKIRRKKEKKEEEGRDVYLNRTKAYT